MLARNLIFGLGSSAWTAVLGFAVVPFYLRHLGTEAYGLIGFFSTLQVLFQLLDLGMAPALNREVARHAARDDLAGIAPLFKTLTQTYWMLAVLIGLGTALASPALARHWLQSSALSTETVQHAVLLLGVVIACRWPNGIYLSALIGAQRLDVSSVVTAFATTLSSLGAVLTLTYLSPTIEAFFAWQIVAALVGTLLMRHAAWRALGGSTVRRARADYGRLRQIWRFSAGVGLVGLIGLVFTQMDKVLLSRMLSLKDFGSYMLATTVCSGLSIFVMPLFNSIYPRFSALAANHDVGELGSYYRLSTDILTALLFPVAAFLAFFSMDLISVWTGDVDIARAVAPLVALLAIGSALHGVMHIPHALQLAHGQVTLPLIVNGSLLVVMGPLIASLALTFQATGGATAWLILQILYVLLSTWLTHRHLLRELRLTWIVRDVGMPLALSMSIVAALRYAADLLSTASSLRLGIGLLAIGAAGLACVAVSARLRAIVADKLLRPLIKPQAS